MCGRMDSIKLDTFQAAEKRITLPAEKRRNQIQQIEALPSQAFLLVKLYINLAVVYKNTFLGSEEEQNVNNICLIVFVAREDITMPRFQTFFN